MLGKDFRDIDAGSRQDRASLVKIASVDSPRFNQNRDCCDLKHTVEPASTLQRHDVHPSQARPTTSLTKSSMTAPVFALAKASMIYANTHLVRFFQCVQSRTKLHLPDILQTALP